MNTQDPIDIIHKNISLIVIAIIGGIAKLLIDGKRVTITLFLSSTFVAGFVGVMTALLLDPTNFHPALKAFVVGMSGHSSGVVLLVYKGKVVKFIEKLGLVK